MTNFKNYLIKNEKSQSTVEKYVRDALAFCAWLGENALTKEKVLEYKEKLISEYSTASANSVISALNCYFEFLGRCDLKIKVFKTQRSIFADKEKELSKQEYERLLKAGEKNERLYLLIQTICSTGIRVSELKFITVEAAESGQATVNNKGKIRIILLPKDLCKTLKKYAKKKNIKKGSIFVTRNKKPMDRSNIWKMLKALCKAARVAKEKVFPHNLRHLFARTYYKIQKDIVRLADILGHSSINTTRIYTMTTGEEHRKQIDKLNLLRC